MFRKGIEILILGFNYLKNFIYVSEFYNHFVLIWHFTSISSNFTSISSNLLSIAQTLLALPHFTFSEIMHPLQYTYYVHKQRMTGVLPGRGAVLPGFGAKYFGL